MRTITIAVATLLALAGCTTTPRPVEARAAEGVVLEFFEALDVDVVARELEWSTQAHLDACLLYTSDAADE